MSSETPAPLSDAEIEEIAAEWQRKDMRAAAEHTISGSLVAIGRLLATLAAYREIVAAVAGPGGPLTSDEDTGYSCIFCESDDWMPEGRYADVRHTADCPVTRARALLSTSTPEGEDS